MLDADFSDLTVPSGRECRQHCRVWTLLSVMDADRGALVLAAIKAHDIPTSVMARRFKEKGLPIPRVMLDRHRSGDCVCCDVHGTLG